MLWPYELLWLMAMEVHSKCTIEVQPNSLITITKALTIWATPTPDNRVAIKAYNRGATNGNRGTLIAHNRCVSNSTTGTMADNRGVSNSNKDAMPHNRKAIELQRKLPIEVHTMVIEVQWLTKELRAMGIQVQWTVPAEVQEAVIEVQYLTIDEWAVGIQLQWLAIEVP